MPKPVYIICSQSGVEDKRTGLLSHFNVLEKIQIVEASPQEGQKRQSSQLPLFRMVAVWMSVPEDISREFNFEVAVIIPPGAKRIVPAKGTFAFDKALHRFLFEFVGVPIEGPGILQVESRICKAGSDNWLSQTYPIVLELVSPQHKAT